jgi:hypothetical protein
MSRPAQLNTLFPPKDFLRKCPNFTDVPYIANLCMFHSL